MKTYHVANWGKLYENNRSRSVERLGWVPIPNSHDGERYSAIWIEKDGAQLFAAWILILQVASKCNPRGSLIRGTGEAHDAKSLAMRTRAPEAIFSRALEYFHTNHWLSVESSQPAGDRQADGSQLSAACQPGVSQPTGDCGVGVYELNGREGTEGNEERVAPLPVVAIEASPKQPTRRTPTLVEWTEKCRVEHSDWPAENAESAWRHYESVGWKKSKGVPIVKWEQCVTTCYRNWKDGGFGQRSFGQPVANHPMPKFAN